jgi:hypothetical protein
MIGDRILRIIHRLVLVVGLMFSLGATGFATILSDDFTGYTASDLAGNNGGNGPWTSPWTQLSGNINIVTGSGGVGTVSTINSTDPFVRATLAGTPDTYSRTFGTLSGQSNIYFSVLLNVQPAANSQGGVDFFNGVGDEQFVFGKTSNVSTNWGITARPGTSGFDSQNSSNTVPGGVTTLLVGRIDQVNRIATLWVDPDLTLPEAGNTAALTLLFGSGDTSIDRVRLRADGNAGTIWNFDNLSIFYQGDSPFGAVDPTNSTAFRITVVGCESNDIRITWATVGGKTNFVQATSDLASNFTDISSAIAITGVGLTSTNYLDVGVLTNFPSRFYRIRLVP